MSTLSLSPSQTPTGMTQGLTIKLTEMAGHKLLKSAVFQGVPTSEIDAFTKEIGPDVALQYADLIERRFQAHIGRYIVPVNYGAPNAIQAAIDDNAFANTYIYVDVASIPLIGTGEVVEQVHEVHFGEVVYNRDLPAKLKQKGVEAGFPNGYVFANPLTALRYAKENPEKQVKAPRGILFYIGGQLCYLYLHGDSDRRRLDVSKGSPGDHWGKSVRFLVVPAPVVVAPA